MFAAARTPVSSGRLAHPGRKRSPYRTKSYGSEVDETLFGSPARYNDQKDTPRINPDDVAWDPPWVTSPKKTGAPLLWSPFDLKDTEGLNSARKSSRVSTPRRPTTPKNKYRLKKQVPSYVDETLFGTPQKTHQLKTPWATDEKSMPQSQVPWSPPLGGGEKSENPIQTEKIEIKGGQQAESEAGTMRYTPVIKARPGSTLDTPQSQARTRPFRKESVPFAPNVAQKLDFCIENGPNNASEEHHNPDAIVERALKLAGMSRNGGQYRRRANSLEGLSSRSPTPGRYFWKRPASPASTTGRPGTAQSGRFNTHSSVEKPESQVNGLFSATGTRVPLSARGTPRRPESARSVDSRDSVPGLDLSRPSKLYGARTPRSARSAVSSQSSITNRPSWRP